jgi:hypothetical protein
VKASALAEHIVAYWEPGRNGALEAGYQLVFGGIKSGDWVTDKVRPHRVDEYGFSRLLPELATGQERLYWDGQTRDFAGRPALDLTFLQYYLETAWLPAGPTPQWLDAHGLPIQLLLVSAREAGNQLSSSSNVDARARQLDPTPAPQPDPPPTPRKIGRPSPKDEIHRALDALVAGKDQRVHHPNLAAVARLVAQHCKKQIGQIPGWSLRTVTGHIGAWRRGHGPAA